MRKHVWGKILRILSRGHLIRRLIWVWNILNLISHPGKNTASFTKVGGDRKEKEKAVGLLGFYKTSPQRYLAVQVCYFLRQRQNDTEIYSMIISAASLVLKGEALPCFPQARGPLTKPLGAGESCLKPWGEVIQQSPGRTTAVLSGEVGGKGLPPQCCHEADCCPLRPGG